MKNIILIIALATTILASCQSKSVKEAKSKADSTIISNANRSANNSQCFVYIKNRDTASLSFSTINQQVTGTLSYNIFEKDKNNGIISGIVKGDTILVDYTFQSEGTSSVRQVVWLKQGDAWIEGNGDVEEKAGKMQFKNTDSLTFTNSMIFVKTDCK